MVETYQETSKGSILGTAPVAELDLFAQPEPGGDHLATHPWLNFQLDLRSAPFQLWLALGEARSKIAHIASVPIQPDFRERMYQLFLAKGAQATTAIEGNTLSEEQVLDQMQGKLDLPPSQEYLGQEITNIVEALNMVSAHALGAKSVDRLTERRLKDYDRLVLRGLPLNDPDIVPGEYRQDHRAVGTYRCPEPVHLNSLMRQYCEWLNGPDFKLAESTLDPVSMAIIKAVVAHLYFVWIHPFGDGNGRTARLIEFQILLEAGIAQPAAHLLSNHYNQTRTEYYRQLTKASGKGGDVTTLLTYAVSGLVDQLKSQIAWITEQQLEVTWQTYVYDHFRHDRTATGTRRRTLVLALTHQDMPVPRHRIPRLSRELRDMYAGKTMKTISRDLNALVYEDRLVRREGGGYVVDRSIVMGLLPPHRPVS
jgi:Fic family protein